IAWFTFNFLPIALPWTLPPPISTLFPYTTLFRSISSDDNYPVSKKETYFDNNNSFFVSTIFKYENIGHQQVTKKEVTESDKTRLELYVYPQDYSNTPGAFISGMISNHQIAYPIEKVTAIKKGAAI